MYIQHGMFHRFYFAIYVHVYAHVMRHSWNVRGLLSMNIFDVFQVIIGLLGLNAAFSAGFPGLNAACAFPGLNAACAFPGLNASLD